MRRKVLITGCRPGGIGEATAAEFAIERDCDVLVCDRERELVREAAENIREKGGSVQFVHANVSVPAEVDRVMDAVDRLWGRLDVLVNNAGDAQTPRLDNIEKLTPDQFEAILRANWGTAFLVTKAAVDRFMRRQRSGVITFLGSNNGSLGVLGQLAYGTAKAGLVGLVRILAAQLGPLGIRANLVQPGVIRTRSKNWLAREAINAHWAELEGQINPTGRVGQPIDVAKLIAFLASDDASFINGAEFVVDGGLKASGLMLPGLNPAGDFRESYVNVAQALAQTADTKKREAA